MKSVLSAWFLIVFLGSAFACKCRVPSNKDAFFNADFVARFHVDVQSRDGLNVVYNVTIVEAFKIPEHASQNSTVALISPKDSAACGISLDLGKEYLLTGNLPDSRFLASTYSTSLDESLILISSCDQFGAVASEWNSVPEDLKDHLEKKKLENCFKLNLKVYCNPKTD
ncbi:hypothetical protein L596_027769 [Steinernema carpocapsae]|uniref:NTR domain-containing protein n=1 Tax=Steinernema carpocapsae TaxID=34508 RepID=A0A4U5LWH3_STECR|nr:hypothetical protein L596_027769 [Steinernema carpocapsae]